MDMSGMTMTTTSSAATSTSTASSSMSMDMGGSGSGCKISMLWNWYTVNSCFISSTWHNTTEGMFAGSCIGVILLVMSLEFLRRAVKEYDRFIVRSHQIAAAAASTAPVAASAAADTEKNGAAAHGVCPAAIPPFKPSVLQQAVRALLHMLQFAVAYFVMLLAMYYNGYIIICIFIGSYLGYFIFGWETFASSAMGRTSAANEATVCCG